MVTQNSPTFTPTAQKIADRLTAYLGPHTARTAVKTFCLKAFSRGPETLMPNDVPHLLQALRPMLKTFVGKARCEVILEAIAKECNR